MISALEFRNFKVLRTTRLDLGEFTLIVGPNGSGKSTVLQALEALRSPHDLKYVDLLSVGVAPSEKSAVELIIEWGPPYKGTRTSIRWSPVLELHDPAGLRQNLAAIRCYSLDAQAIAQPVGLNPTMELARSGHALPGVLDRLRDRYPERFEALNAEFGRMLPEFDRILFDTPIPGQRSLLLRTRSGGHAIAAPNVSQGTLLALTLLTLAYLPSPAPVIGLEEPDRGIHPRLLREVRDALYRLSFPDKFGEKRGPVQIVATTHSPYFLDLFRHHPEQIVIAQKEGLEARFERLIDRADIQDILGEAPLGEVWFSGVLGGTPGGS